MKRPIPFCPILLFLLFVQSAIGQTTAPNQKEFQLTIKPAKMTIKLDGVMDEAAWNTVTAVTDFKKKFPNDIGDPQKTNRSQIFIRRQVFILRFQSVR